MSNNSHLHRAKKRKNDEYYTELCDITAEMEHYTAYFNGKIIYCNCDNPYLSNFWLFFHHNFKQLGLSQLISTHYEDDGSSSYALIYSGGNDLKTDDGVKIKLNGSGDFRSDECIDFLKKADIVVTNPPYSLVSDYIKQLLDHEKKFIILCNQNTLTYKTVFQAIKQGMLWCGYTHGKMRFRTPNSISMKDENDLQWCSFGCMLWYTNIDIERKQLFITPKCKYDKNIYPKYDNYDAIEVSKLSDIPEYDGIMGVPITFMYYYNPDQFSIVDMNPHFLYTSLLDNSSTQLTLKHANLKDPYARILIQKKNL